MIKFEYYITVRWTAAEREAPNFRNNANAIRLQYIREGLCREFKKHLDANPNIVTQQQIDDEAQRWARETIDGREFTKNCKKSEATHALLSCAFAQSLTFLSAECNCAAKPWELRQKYFICSGKASF